jgi:hypothetical protein
MVNLKEIINRIKAKSCFIPKNRFLTDYEKERFAWIYFENFTNMENTRKLKFSFKNKGLVFTDYNAITYHVCGSPFHKIRECPEHKKKLSFNQ